jgi:hypothetical protein
MSAERSNETCGGGSGCGRDDLRPALRGELHRHGANSTGRAEDQHGVSRPKLERVETLQCGQAGGGNRSGIAQVEALRDTSHVRGVCGGKLCIEATLAIAPLVRIDVVAESKAADSRAFGDDNSGPSTPGTKGNRGRPGCRSEPSRIEASQLPMPAVSSAMSTSCGPGVGTGTSCSVSFEGGPNRSIAIAFMRAGIADGDSAVARDIRRRVMNTLRCVVRSSRSSEAVEPADAPAGRLVVASGGPRD